MTPDAFGTPKCDKNVNTEAKTVSKTRALRQKVGSGTRGVAGGWGSKMRPIKQKMRQTCDPLGRHK